MIAIPAAPVHTPEPLTDWLNLRRRTAAEEARYAPLLRAHRLSLPQVAALLYLVHHHAAGDAPRMRAISDHLAQETQTTTDLIDRLERRGLVARHDSPTDRRLRLVRLTDAGYTLTVVLADGVRRVEGA